MKAVYMYIDTSDEFLLPLAVADTAAQLAKMTGTNKVNILSSIYHAKERKLKEEQTGRVYQGETKCKFEKVMIEEEDEWLEAYQKQ